MMSSNLERLKIIANGLKDLNKHVVFVGGSVAELYADNPAADDIRMTEDVDCVVELTSYRGLYELEEEIRKLGFSNDVSPGAPICRWVYKGETVDIMPNDQNILGFSINGISQLLFIGKKLHCQTEPLLIFFLLYILLRQKLRQ